MSNSLKLTPEEEEELTEIREKSKKKHEKKRKAAAKRGRKDFPLLPYECSWAFEEEYRRRKHNA